LFWLARYSLAGAVVKHFWSILPSEAYEMSMNQARKGDGLRRPRAALGG